MDVREVEVIVQGYYLELLEQQVGRKLDFNGEVQPLVRRWFAENAGRVQQIRHSKAEFTAAMRELFQGIARELSHDRGVLGEVQQGRQADEAPRGVLD